MTIYVRAILIYILITAQTFANDQKYKKLLNELSQIYLSSMTFIFKNQGVINKNIKGKENLFGQKFLKNVKATYQKKYKKPFPEEHHIAKVALLKSMVEVMENNRALIYDSGIKFKGLIPATFAFQLSEKMYNKGIGVKIKFTTNLKNIRNIKNRPDLWESSIMSQIIKDGSKKSYTYKGFVKNKVIYRQFTPLPMKKFCLKCHGIPADNPLNFDRPKSEWTDVDMTGFKMEGWTISDFGGGTSVSIEKTD